jgi:PhnB protein
MNPYLTFDGTCEAAFKFYEAKLGGKVDLLMSFEGSPIADQVPETHRKRIMHARMTLEGNVLMASDCMPGQPYEGMKGFALSLNPRQVGEAERLFAALSDGGRVSMPLAPTFWALRFGMVTDRFGVPWMVNCDGAAA